MSNILKRTTLLVRDAEKSAAWYAEVFGMKRWLDTPFTLSGVGLAIGEKGDKTRLIIMQCDDLVIGMIGLLQWVEPTLESPPIPTKVLFGMPIFVVASDDVKGVYERAKSSGVNIYAEPYDWSFTAPDGSIKEMIGCSFFDLDGYFYEINQTIE
jgi:catechol 2,3-dioxygenase-like lactoylglutathione lyase family enzyme